jgi:hypothetical protein
VEPTLVHLHKKRGKAKAKAATQEKFNSTRCSKSHRKFVIHSPPYPTLKHQFEDIFENLLMRYTLIYIAC